MQTTPRVKKICRRLVMELKIEQTSACDPKSLEEWGGLGGQQDKSCVDTHTAKHAMEEF